MASAFGTLVPIRAEDPNARAEKKENERFMADNQQEAGFAWL